MPHPTRLMIALIGTLLAVSACGSDTDETAEKSSKYCGLISRKTVAPIVGDSVVKDNGGPFKRKKAGDRMVQCGLSEDDGGGRLFLTVFESDFNSGYPAQGTRAETVAAMRKYAKEDPEHYIALEGRRDDLGYATYTDKKVIGQPVGTLAAGFLVTEKRVVSVTALATPDQAEEYVPLMLKIAQEYDENLEAWDAANPS